VTEEIATEYPEQIKFAEYDTTLFSISITGLTTTIVGSNEKTVSNIEYLVVADKADGSTKSFTGTVIYDSDTLSTTTTFIPYSELTENTVLSWVEANASIESIKRSLTSPDTDTFEGKTKQELPWLPNKPSDMG